MINKLVKSEELRIKSEELRVKSEKCDQNVNWKMKDAEISIRLSI